MNIKETRCDCCGKVLNKHMDKIIHGKFNRKEYFYDSQGGCFVSLKYDFCETCWNNLIDTVRQKTKEDELPKNIGFQIIS